MLKIGEFSKLSYLTIKALRFYEKEGLLIPQKVDQKTGYRFYKTSQLTDAAMIKSYRQLGLTIEEIKEIYRGADKKKILISKAKMLENQKKDIEACLSIINHILESDEMSYQVTVKEIPETIVYYSEVKVKKYSESARIKFKKLPATKALSLFYKGAYDEIGEAYSFLMKCVEDNDYHVSGLARECYIDGIWNKKSVDEWLTEIQLPII